MVSLERTVLTEHQKEVNERAREELIAMGVGAGATAVAVGLYAVGVNIAAVRDALGMPPQEVANYLPAVLNTFGKIAVYAVPAMAALGYFGSKVHARPDGCLAEQLLHPPSSRQDGKLSLTETPKA